MCAALACSQPGGEIGKDSVIDAVRESANASLPPRCFRSSESVLFGPATGSGQQGAGPGWLRLESPGADSGFGELVDADHKGLGASWRRVSLDSVSIVAFDDFLRVEMRLALFVDSAAGPVRASSDAALERDSAGRLQDLRREWVLRAASAPCDSMPTR
jgi:hypothetical protein